jgi:hypothetical protein
LGIKILGFGFGYNNFWVLGLGFGFGNNNLWVLGKNRVING